MNDLQVFQNNDFGEIRTMLIDGEPWFVGKDIAENLGYKDTSSALKRHVDEDDKLSRCFTDSGQSREMYIINESGLYSLILSSKLPQAKRFKRWVTSEVIPSIRQHGGYLTQAKVDEILSNPDTIIQLATQIKEYREKINTQSQIIGELQPKADYTDRILKSKSLVTIGQIAKDYGMSARKMNTLLHELGVQYKQSGQWLLYAKYHDKGYTHSETMEIESRSNPGESFVKMNTKWTQKGRLFLYDLLKDGGYLPVIEQAIA